MSKLGGFKYTSCFRKCDSAKWRKNTLYSYMYKFYKHMYDYLQSWFVIYLCYFFLFRGQPFEQWHSFLRGVWIWDFFHLKLFQNWICVIKFFKKITRNGPNRKRVFIQLIGITFLNNKWVKWYIFPQQMFACKKVEFFLYIEK